MEKVSATRSIRIIGGIIGVISIGCAIIFETTRAVGNLWLGYVGNCIMFIGVLFSILLYNRHHQNKESSKASFTVGVRTTILATIIYAAFLLIFYMMFGEKKNTALQYDNDGISTFWLFFFGDAFFINIIVGLCASLIGAFVFNTYQNSDEVNER
ncbi:hypothetical protein DVR12_09140 [Chitinophaga silvatica]|uniref:DUF4199 domain-containing protein n=1 Tax=Chitinophaga silvatica TaxID=2282649 RepID=A0A3E1YCH2_9BACT|nr:T3SS effector cysteine hydrolase SpvD family protein [Chitinophaga silvatica]RFS24037.1 hypothetical protein DVR12_09140 [Chitinophaga silvatica]